MKQPTQHAPTFRIVPAGAFKATCLQLMDEVCEDVNLSIVITKRGKPVALLSAPPAGLRISGPTAALQPESEAVVSAVDGTAAGEDRHGKKHKGKKKKRK